MTRRIFTLGLIAGIAVATVNSAHAQPPAPAPSGDLRITVVDVDGGAAVLFVTPEGKSLLIDTGWPASRGVLQSAPASPNAAPVTTSADRIVAAADSMGVKKIDYLLMTHYHVDHLGGLDSLVKKLPVDMFIDHGPNREPLDLSLSAREIAAAPEKWYPNWTAAYQGHKHVTVKAGQTLWIGSLELMFLTSDGAVIPSSLPGAGQPNPLCAHVPQLDKTGGEENVRSLGMLMTFGKTRILNLGDLTWNKELELLCPTNKIGTVDVYFVTGHGMDISSSPPTAALDPLVAVMQNGPTKGGDAAVIKTIRTYPDLKALWRAHASRRTPELNGDPDYIANLDQQPDHAYPIEMAITPAGQITVTNARQHFSKTYMARAAQKQAAH